MPVHLLHVKKFNMLESERKHKKEIDKFLSNINGNQKQKIKFRFKIHLPKKISERMTASEYFKKHDGA